MLAAVSLVGLAALTGVGSAQTQGVPTNTVEPRVTGTAMVGSRLTATRGSWTESPTSYEFQWTRCPSSGGAADASNCAVIGGASTEQYVPGNADVGKRLRVRVTASNADGAKTVASNATAIVLKGGKPAKTTEPSISGTAAVGSTLTARVYQGGAEITTRGGRYSAAQVGSHGGEESGGTAIAFVARGYAVMGTEGAVKAALNAVSRGGSGFLTTTLGGQVAKIELDEGYSFVRREALQRYAVLQMDVKGRMPDIPSGKVTGASGGGTAAVSSFVPPPVASSSRRTRLPCPTSSRGSSRSSCPPASGCSRRPRPSCGCDG